MSEIVTTTRRKRREVHTVEVAFDVTGAPVLEREPRESSKPLAAEPSIVNLTYSRHGERWFVHARVYGLPTTGSRMLNVWIDLYFDPTGGEECDWPGWLRKLADEQHPARPGGWPGDDPEGSYL